MLLLMIKRQEEREAKDMESHQISCKKDLNVQVHFQSVTVHVLLRFYFLVVNLQVPQNNSINEEISNSLETMGS